MSAQTQQKPIADPFDTASGTDADFANLAALMSAFAAAQNESAAVQYGVDERLHAALEDARLAFTALQERSGRLEAQIKAIAARHPEWFEARKSLPVPSGTIKLTRSTSLESANEELTLSLLTPILGADLAPHFLRQTQSLNLEALETLTDAQLTRLHLRRVVKENFKLEPAKVNLGKAAARKAAEAGEVAK